MGCFNSAQVVGVVTTVFRVVLRPCRLANPQTRRHHCSPPGRTVDGSFLLVESRKSWPVLISRKVGDLNRLVAGSTLGSSHTPTRLHIIDLFFFFFWHASHIFGLLKRTKTGSYSPVPFPLSQDGHRWFMGLYTASERSEKSLEPSRKRILLGVLTNITTGPLGFWKELDTWPKGEWGSYHNLEADRPGLTDVR